MKFLIKTILLSIISGILLIFCFPRFDLSPLAFISLIPLFFALIFWQNKEFKKFSKLWGSFFLGFLCGFIFFLGLLNWAITVRRIGRMGVPAWILLSAEQAIYFGIFAICMAILFNILKLKKNMYIWYLILFNLTSSLLWVIMEYLRAYGTFGFTWGILGYSQYKNLYFIQIADIFGTYFISFLIILINMSLTLTLHIILDKKETKDKYLSMHHNRMQTGPMILYLILPVLLLNLSNLFYGHYKLQKKKSGSIKVAIIQGNLPRDVPWDFHYQDYVLDFYLNLSEKTKEFNPDIIVWPESLVAYGDLQDYYLLSRFQQIAQKLNSVFVVGCFDEGHYGQDFNTAVVFSAEGKILGKYHKRQLVPFGEFVPFKSFFKFINYNPWGSWKDLTPGKEFKVIDTPIGRLGFNICYETTFPYISRRLTQKGAQIIIGLVADSWFKPDTTYQHTAMFVFRAIENRIWCIRSADTGISCLVNPLGEVYRYLPPDEPAQLLGKVGRRKELTLYTRFGNLWIFLGLFIMIMLIGINIVSHQRNEKR